MEDDDFEIAPPLDGYKLPIADAEFPSQSSEDEIALPIQYDPKSSSIENAQKRAIQIGGGVVGGTLGLTRAGIKTATNMKDQYLAGQQALNMLSQVLSGNLPPPGGPMENLPAGGKGTANWARAFGMADPEALRARSQAEASQMGKAAMEAENKIRSMYGGSAYQIVPERASLMLDKTAIPAKAASTSEKLAKLMAINPQLMRYLSLGGKGLSSVLGGVGAASEGMEALEQGQRGNVPAAVVSGLSALSSGIGSIAPSTLPVTAPLSLGIMAGRAIGETDPVRRGLANAMEYVRPIR
jgi:hypothetical protein